MKLGGLDAQGCAAHCETEARRCVTWALSATPDDLGGFSPLLDIAAAAQASLEERLFQT